MPGGSRCGDSATVLGDLLQVARLAVHDAAPAVDGDLTAFLELSRIFSRPRWTRDFMHESDVPSISAASFWVSPWSSVSVMASRYGEGSRDEERDALAELQLQIRRLVRPAGSGHTDRGRPGPPPARLLRHPGDGGANAYL
jgi:hypothetical protein